MADGTRTSERPRRRAGSSGGKRLGANGARSTCRAAPSRISSLIAGIFEYLLPDHFAGPRYRITTWLHEIDKDLAIARSQNTGQQLDYTGEDVGIANGPYALRTMSHKSTERHCPLERTIQSLKLFWRTYDTAVALVVIRAIDMVLAWALPPSARGMKTKNSDFHERRTHRVSQRPESLLCQRRRSPGSVNRKRVGARAGPVWRRRAWPASEAT